MSAAFTPRNIAIAAVVLGLVLLPVYVGLTGDRFILTLFTRIVILAMAAVSLNLILGYGGMMSFGHAAYLGIGGHNVALPAFERGQGGVRQRPAALATSAFLPPARR